MSHQRNKAKGPLRVPSRIAGGLLDRLEESGWKAAIVPIHRLVELRDEIEGRRRREEFAQELYQERYSFFDFDVTTAKTGAQSILIVAAPQPYVRLTVTLDNHCFPVIIPPTYSERIDKEVEGVIKSALKPDGYVVFRKSMPLKLLAVRSGLAHYGRNNLAYVDGVGSYCRLLGFYTGLAVDNSSWSEPRILEECEKCTACIMKCPTGAITENRFLIRAENCLTFHNEREVVFPSDLQPHWHHCLLGCLYCQTYCPVNRKADARIEEGGSLDARDTAVLLEGGPAESLSMSGRQIMEEFAFLDALSELARNLKVLLFTPGNVETGSKLLHNINTEGRYHVR